MEGINWKMKKTRLLYFLLLIGIIILGLLSRKIEAVPLFVGDLLYAQLVYFIMRFVFINTKPLKIALLSLLTCYGIEICQLCQVQWLADIRSTQIGRLILGQGFLWSDMAAYTLGIAIAYGIETYRNRQNRLNPKP